MTKLPTPIIKGSLDEVLSEQGTVVGLHGSTLPDKISVEVDLAYPTETIKHEFDLLLTKCKNILKFQNSLPLRIETEE